MKERLFGLTAPKEDFSPAILRLQREAPSPLGSGAVMWVASEVMP